MNQEPITVDSQAVTPLLNTNETQIIFQRHCNYDRTNGGLVEESIKEQQKIIFQFISSLGNNPIDLKNTYFLFDASMTSSSTDFKRCVETTSIAMDAIKTFFQTNGIPTSHIINLNEELHYNNSIHENRQLVEPKMFTDGTGFREYLEEKHGGINQNFWIDFEEDQSKEKRQQLGAEGPDEIVNRANFYINVLKRYAKIFHSKFPNSRLIIWCGTHYDVISPLVKQKVLNYDKEDIVKVDYCGGISLLIDTTGNIMVNMNGTNYPFDSQYNKQPQKHF